MSSAKETSDALNPPMVEVAHVVVPAHARTAGDNLALALATCGVGLIPLAPGTWGSAVGVVVYLSLGRAAQTTFDYVVAREVAGQLVAFLFVPWGAGWWTVVACFVAFRAFDIWKPYPVRRLEDLGGGLGVMADDLLAGFYAAALMSLLISIQILF